MRRPWPHRSTDPDAPRTRRERAQATVEFAIILPILVTILFAVVEFGMAFWHYQQVSAAASEGARRGAVSRTSGDPTGQVVEAVRNSSPGLDASQLDVQVSSSWGVGDPLTVTVSYPEDVTIFGRTFFSQDLEVSRTMRVEQ